MFCRNCGSQMDPQAVVCVKCGVPKGTGTSFCPSCGSATTPEAVICTTCGRQVEIIKEQAAQPNIVINNSNSNVNSNINQNTVSGLAGSRKAKNKWVSLFLCLFLGMVGAHKFYEGKTGMGILYLFTGGLCGVGVLIDLIIILTKPNPYYV